ncbi:hypothetical protein NNO_0517 [Hydrogenimonas sp.]|nr:hypothetical protein NNO_0517 [Hydrogenimonas sp.]
MGRLTVTILLITAVAAASDINVYERNCVECHRKLPVSLDKFFFNYLLKYSSERRVKKALRNYLKHPRKKASLATDELVSRYGLMPKTKLSDEELRRAIDIYWEKYKVFGKIE